MRNLVERATAITVLATALVASGAGHARAGLITYTETATVSGSLGSTTFTDATITTTQTADTAGILTNPISHTLRVPDITSTLVISGGDLASPLSASFSFTTYTFSSPSATAGGFGELHVFGPLQLILPVLAEVNAAFATYDLATSLGPISGQSFLNQAVPFATTAGFLILNEADTVTFQATVPEPSSLALAAVACTTGLAISAARRRRQVGR